MIGVVHVNADEIVMLNLNLEVTRKSIHRVTLEAEKVAQKL